MANYKKAARLIKKWIIDDKLEYAIKALKVIHNGKCKDSNAYAGKVLRKLENRK